MRMGDYIRPASLHEALARYNEEEGLIFAGGTNLMVKGRDKNPYQEKRIIDIHDLSELRKIQETEQGIQIGACVTLAEICDSSVLSHDVPLLLKAVSQAANCQIRNRATLAGNIANACPASDCIPVLMVLEAEIITESLKGKRKIPIKELFRDCKACLRHESMQVRTCFYSDAAGKKTTLFPGEIITAVRIPRQEKTNTHLFYKLTQNHSSDLGMVNLAMTGNKDSKGTIQSLRVSMGGLFARPRVFEELNHIIIGRKPTEQCFLEYADKAVSILQQESSTLTDYEYKKTVMKYLIEDGCKQLFLGIPMD